MSRVFVSSTCYDLIDCRAEVEAELRSLGLTPVMSDRIASGFKVEPNANSIESCLVNVRKSDICVVILSRRYGPSLAKLGYDDVSATHLEYLEARKEKKPVFMYVRDRLEADYGIWRANRGRELDFAWVSEQDRAIFDLLDKHKRASSRSKNNWYWVFRDSVELKERLRNDLRVPAGEAVLRQLVQAGDVPILVSRIYSADVQEKENRCWLDIAVSNVGRSAAIEPQCTLLRGGGADSVEVQTLLPGSEEGVSFDFDLPSHVAEERLIEVGVEWTYTTYNGHYLGDSSLIELAWNPGDTRIPTRSCTYTSKKYYESDAFGLDVAEE